MDANAMTQFQLVKSPKNRSFSLKLNKLKLIISYQHMSLFLICLFLGTCREIALARR